MSLVQHQLRHPDTGQPLKNKSVKVQLASDGFNGHVEIIQTSFPTTDDTGHLSIDLTPNEQITPANTHYVMTLTKGPTWTFIVPATTQPTGGFWLNDILVTSPPDPDEMFFGLPTPFGPDGQVVKMVAGVPAWDDEAGGGGGAPTGPAGGVLAGTYPDPSFAVDMATQAELDAAAAAAQSAAITAAAADATTKANAAQSAATTAAAADATSKANAAQAAATSAAATDATTKVGTEAAARAAADALLIPLTQKAAANGVATLGSDGTIPTAQIPSIAIVDYLGAAANQAAMLALTGQKGDWCTRTDLGTTWVIKGSDPTQLSSWQQLSYPTAPVLSVNTQTGAVVLGPTDVGAQPVDPDLATIAALDASTPGVLSTDGAGWIRKTYAQIKTALALVKADVGLGNVDNTSDVNKPVSTAQQTALNLKADDSAVVHNTGPESVAGVKTFASSPIVPTPAQSDNSTKAASTAYVDTGLATKASVLTRTAVKTAIYTPALWDLVPCDTSGGTFAVTLPAASGGKGRIVLKWVAGTTGPSVALTGADHINTTTGPTSVATSSWPGVNTSFTFESDGVSTWTATVDSYPLSVLDTRYSRATLGFTTGFYYGVPENVVSYADATIAAGVMMVYPFWLPSAIAITKLIHRVDSVGTAPVGAMVVYGDTGSSYPGALQAYAVSSYTSGNQSTTVNGSTATIGPGLVWIGEYVSSATVAPQIMAAVINNGGPNRYIAANGIRGNLTSAAGLQVTGVAGVTPPSTFPAGATLVSTPPLVQFAP